MRIGSRIGVGGEGGHTDHRAIGGVFVHGVERGIRIADRSRIELVDVGHGDREACESGSCRRVLVARTVIERLAPSASRSIAPATVTMPVLASMAKRPPSLLSKE